jgi:hypothetical protein
MQRLTALVLASALLLSACAPSFTPSAKPDADLSCAEIRGELNRAQQARRDAQSNKGVSAQNVAWFLIFWPGIAANEITNSDVIRRADERIATLNQVYARKGCRN